jgi:hypothetical protein
VQDVLAGVARILVHLGMAHRQYIDVAALNDDLQLLSGFEKRG